MKTDTNLTTLEVEVLLIIHKEPSYGYKIVKDLNNQFCSKHSLQKVYYCLYGLKAKGYLKTTKGYNNLKSLRIIYKHTPKIKIIFSLEKYKKTVQQYSQYRFNF